MANGDQGKTGFRQAGQAKQLPKTGAVNELRQRWMSIWADERPFKKRLLTAVFPCFLLPFIVLFFGPLDILIANNTYFNVSYLTFLLPCSLIMLATFVLLLVFSALMRGRVFDFVLCFLLALSVCLYVQGNFMNLDLGALDGTAISWQFYKKPALLGIIAWALIFLAVFAVEFFFHRSFPQISLFICVLLFVMQSAALVQDISTVDKSGNYFLSGKDEYVLASDENIVVFILDGFSNDLMTEIAEKHPEELEAFRDFTCYNNYNTGYMGTFPGELHMITSFDYDFSLGYEENFDKAWSDSLVRDYFSDLHTAGFETRVFTNSLPYLCGSDPTRISIAASNLVSSTSYIVSTENVKKFVYLSLYRYVPQAMKANFWIYSGNIHFEQDEETIETEDDFISMIRENGLAVGDADKYISYYMLHGPHAPWQVDADGNCPGTQTSYEEQGRGYLKACGEYIQQMRDLGIYDDATIIITADHGSYYEETPDQVFTDTQALFLIKEKGDHGETMTYNHAPVSQLDFRSTMLYSAGLDYEKYGPSVFDFDEDDVRERSVYMWTKDSGSPGTGYYNQMNEYRYTGDNEALLNIIENDEPITHPLIDSFY